MKREEFLNKIEAVRIDAINYLQDYLLPLLRGTNLESENEYIEFFYFDTDTKEDTKIHSIDSDGCLNLIFDYPDGEEIEDVPLERLTFIGLIQLVEILEEYLENK